MGIISAAWRARGLGATGPVGRNVLIGTMRAAPDSVFTSAMLDDALRVQNSYDERTPDITRQIGGLQSQYGTVNAITDSDGNTQYRLLNNDPDGKGMWATPLTRNADGTVTRGRSTYSLKDGGWGEFFMAASMMLGPLAAGGALGAAAQAATTGAGTAATSAMGLEAGSFGAGVVGGAVNGAVQGAAVGAATGQNIGSSMLGGAVNGAIGGGITAANPAGAVGVTNPQAAGAINGALASAATGGNAAMGAAGGLVNSLRPSSSLYDRNQIETGFFDANGPGAAGNSLAPTPTGAGTVDDLDFSGLFGSGTFDNSAISGLGGGLASYSDNTTNVGTGGGNLLNSSDWWSALGSNPFGNISFTGDGSNVATGQQPASGTPAAGSSASGTNSLTGLLRSLINSSAGRSLLGAIGGAVNGGGTAGAGGAGNGMLGNALNTAALASLYSTANGEYQDARDDYNAALTSQQQQLAGLTPYVSGMQRAATAAVGTPSAVNSQFLQSLRANAPTTQSLLQGVTMPGAVSAVQTGTYTPGRQTVGSYTAAPAYNPGSVNFNSTLASQGANFAATNPYMVAANSNNATTAALQTQATQAQAQANAQLTRANNAQDAVLKAQQALGARKTYGQAEVQAEAQRLQSLRQGSVDRALTLASSQGFGDALRRGLSSSSAAETVRDDTARKFADTYSTMQAQSSLDANNTIGNLSNMQDSQRTSALNEAVTANNPALAASLYGTAASNAQTATANWANSSQGDASRRVSAVGAADASGLQSGAQNLQAALTGYNARTAAQQAAYNAQTQAQRDVYAAQTAASTNTYNAQTQAQRDAYQAGNTARLQAQTLTNQNALATTQTQANAATTAANLRSTNLAQQLAALTQQDTNAMQRAQLASTSAAQGAYTASGLSNSMLNAAGANARTAATERGRLFLPMVQSGSSLAQSGASALVNAIRGWASDSGAAGGN